MSSIVQANNFEIKLALLTLINHNAFANNHEDPYEHLATLFQLCDIVKRLMEQLKKLYTWDYLLFH